MNITKKLVMTFKNEADEKISLTVDDPKNDIKEADIKTVMDLIIAKNIFAPKGCDLVSAIEAKVVTTDTTDYDLVIE